jgi:hypothetical protein
MTHDIRIFGIRHHGPGSARSLVAALHAFGPDIVLVEGPPDAESLIPMAGHADMEPPVAMLVYNPKDLEQASFFPFAGFSPEWQALRYALSCNVPVRFMDLPMSHAFALRQTDVQLTLEMTPSRGQDEKASRDPFRKIALLAGYTDPERWWDAMIERHTPDAGQDPGAIFTVMLDLMRALRDDKSHPERRETLLREAYMRQTIRTAQKEGFAKIAVVCGAWHAPALAETGGIKPSADAAVLKGLKKIKTDATWIPWSFDRLASQNGYSAGVVAPAWYSVLWESATAAGDTQEPVVRWLTQAARLLRDNDIAVSSAHVIEATRLAGALAALRSTALPGIEELREAAVTVLCNGAEAPLELIDRQLVIGDVLGAVPAHLPVPPLKADFEKAVKSCRLEKNTQEKILELDLREAAHLRKSQLLHRLNLLGIAWGTTADSGGGKQGGFHEHWKLKWLPDFEIRLIEAGTWGNTIEDAAGRRAHHNMRDMSGLPELTQLLGVVLKSELPLLVPPLLQKLQQISALARDTLLLADAVLPLAEVLRYGSARRLNLDAVEQLLGQIIPRVMIQLPAACTGIDGDAAAGILKKILAINRALGILQWPGQDESWQKTLSLIGTSAATAPLLAGLATRMLFDKSSLTPEQTGDAMRFRLSRAQPPGESAQWLEGFLYGSGLLLLHHRELWMILDDWMGSFSEEAFVDTLPLLRRTFSQFSPPERQKMLDLAKHGAPAVETQPDGDWDADRAAGVLEFVRTIFQSG